MLGLVLINQNWFNFMVLNMKFYLILLLFANNLFTWLSNHMLPCVFKKITGYNCPGCGIQRSVLALLKGNLYQSFMLYPATIPLIILVGFGIYQSKKPINYGAKIIFYGYILVAAIILVNYTVKITYS